MAAKNTDASDSASSTEEQVKEVTVELLGLPEGAKIAVDGDEVPNPIVMPASPHAALFVIEAEGYTPLHKEIVFDKDRVIQVEMALLPPEKPAKPRNAAKKVFRPRNQRVKKGKASAPKKDGWEANPF